MDMVDIDQDEISENQLRHRLDQFVYYYGRTYFDYHMLLGLSRIALLAGLWSFLKGHVRFGSSILIPFAGYILIEQLSLFIHRLSVRHTLGLRNDSTH